MFTFDAIKLLITSPAVFAESIAGAHEELSAELLTGVLSKLRGMVTVMTTDGHVIYQNSASIAGMGNLQRHAKPAGFFRARRLGAADTDDAMQRIFQAAPDKLEEMQEAIEAGKVRCLCCCHPASIASVHVACLYAQHTPDMHAGIAAHANRLC
jgi:hypothetical protein